MTAYIHSFTLKYLHLAVSQKPSGFVPGQGPFSNLLTGLLMEQNCTTYGSAYRTAYGPNRFIRQKLISKNSDCAPLQIDQLRLLALTFETSNDYFPSGWSSGNLPRNCRDPFKPTAPRYKLPVSLPGASRTATKQKRASICRPLLVRGHQAAEQVKLRNVYTSAM